LQHQQQQQPQQQQQQPWQYMQPPMMMMVPFDGRFFGMAPTWPQQQQVCLFAIHINNITV
jgi:hypothetical protein